MDAAAQQHERRLALTVELHDVHPGALTEVRSMHRALRRVGVERPTLLVVPRFRDPDGRVLDLRRHPGLCAWLRRRQSEGCEVVLHGLSHRAPGPPPPGLRKALMHNLFSRGCAEFAHLDGPAARRRLRLGRAILAACGLRCRGFIAPAWQQSAAAIAQLAGLGFRFTAFLTHVLCLDPAGAHRALRTPALTFDAPNPAVDLGKRGVMRTLEHWARRLPLLRVALHPADLHGARPLGHILRRIRALLRWRRLVSYRTWFAGIPATRPGEA